MAGNGEIPASLPALLLMTLLHFKLIPAVYHRFNITVFWAIWIQFFANPADNIGNRKAAAGQSLMDLYGMEIRSP